MSTATYTVCGNRSEQGAVSKEENTVLLGHKDSARGKALRTAFTLLRLDFPADTASGFPHDRLDRTFFKTCTAFHAVGLADHKRRFATRDASMPADGQTCSAGNASVCDEIPRSVCHRVTPEEISGSSRRCCCWTDPSRWYPAACPARRSGRRGWRGSRRTTDRARSRPAARLRSSGGPLWR